MNSPILHQSEIDVIALETKHQKDYERACQEREFIKKYQENSHSAYEVEGCFRSESISNRLVEDGKYDGELDIEPQPYQWFDSKYRKGYLAGVTNRFNEQFSA